MASGDFESSSGFAVIAEYRNNRNTTVVKTKTSFSPLLTNNFLILSPLKLNLAFMAFPYGVGAVAAPAGAVSLPAGGGAPLIGGVSALGPGGFAAGTVGFPPGPVSCGPPACGLAPATVVSPCPVTAAAAA